MINFVLARLLNNGVKDHQGKDVQQKNQEKAQEHLENGQEKDPVHFAQLQFGVSTPALTGSKM